MLNSHDREVDGKIMPIFIYGSSSQQGTTIYFKPTRTLFDVGADFTKFKNIVHEVDVVVISHEHEDHLKWPVLQNMLKLQPNLKIILPKRIKIPTEYGLIGQHAIRLANGNSTTVRLRDNQQITIATVQTPHGNAVSNAFKITLRGTSLLFATDLSDTKTLFDDKFDLIMIEMNYDENEFISSNGSGGSVNHLSYQQALVYTTAHLTEVGHYIPLHFGPTMQYFNQLA